MNARPDSSNDWRAFPVRAFAATFVPKRLPESFVMKLHPWRRSFDEAEDEREIAHGG
jgi:hypothetical protein